MYRTCQVVQRADVAVAAYWATGRTGSQQARGRGANDHGEELRPLLQWKSSQICKYVCYPTTHLDDVRAILGGERGHVGRGRSHDQSGGDKELGEGHG